MEINEILKSFLNGIIATATLTFHYGWWGLFGILVYFVLFPLYLDTRRRIWISKQKHTILKIQVPRENEKTPLTAEQMFANIQGMWQPIEGFDLYWKGQVLEHVSWEIVSIGGQIYYLVGVPDNFKDIIISQIHAAYPDAEIEEVKDYTNTFDWNKHDMAGFEFRFFKENAYPIRSYPEIERQVKTEEARIDAMEGLTSIMNRIGEKEQYWIQILTRPTVDDYWIKEGENIINEIKGEKPEVKAGALSNALALTQETISRTVSSTMGVESETPSTQKNEFERLPLLIDTEREIVMRVGQKISKPGYECKIRILYMADKDVFSLKTRIPQIVGAFQQFKTNNLNAFKFAEFTKGKIGWFELKFWTNWKKRKFLKQFQQREFSYWDRGIVLNTEELATIYHLPEIHVKVPTIHKITSKRAAAPVNLPIEGSTEDLTIFAQTNFRENKVPFGIKDEDRTRHIYVIGKTGMGKTAMLGNMIISDIRRNKGVALVDPHGDLAERVLDFIPNNRINDVVYFNPSDQDFPIGFNVLENVDPEFRGLVASGLIGIFKKIWAESWGPRLEYILRYTILALLEYPSSTILGILRMLSDSEYRKKVIKTIKDPVVKAFWINEFANYNDRLRAEAVAPIQNKVGQFVSNPIMRNILGQTKSTIDIEEIMDQGKILLVNLSKGRIGEDNSALLGAMLITKMQLGAMRRAYIPEHKRKDFYLFVDEFQNFATESFATILSEARKYRLSLTIAHQYITQMEEEVRDAVFGNVGTMIIFRIGAVDAEFIEQETMPTITAMDLVDLDKYDIYVKLAIDGITSRAFSATTLEPYTDITNNHDKAVRVSRERYGRRREVIEEKIGRWSEATIESVKEERARREKNHKRRSHSRSSQNFYHHRPDRYSPSRPRPKTSLTFPPREDSIKVEGKSYKVLDTKNIDNILSGESTNIPEVPEEEKK